MQERGVNDGPQGGGVYNTENQYHLTQQQGLQTRKAGRRELEIVLQINGEEKKVKKSGWREVRFVW